MADQWKSMILTSTTNNLTQIVHPQTDTKNIVDFEESTIAIINKYKAKANGLASLDAGGNVPENQLGNIKPTIDSLKEEIEKNYIRYISSVKPTTGNIELWDVEHRYGVNYVPKDVTNKGWNSLGQCKIYYTIENTIKNQPTVFGQLINIPADENNESTQLWIEQPGGEMYYRGGNGTNIVNDTKFSKMPTQETVYPTGSIYLTMRNSNPADILGFGTWEQIKDCYLYCKSDLSSGTAVDTREGSNSVTLSVNNMPPHNHGGGTSSWNGDHTHLCGTCDMHDAPGLNINNNTGDTLYDYRNNGFVTRTTSSAGGHNHTFSTNNAGGGKAFNISPVRIPIFAWYRKS